MAANFVSFTLIEDERFTEDAKKQFFKRFYDIISQAVYYSLYYAYPKSRKRLDEVFMRKLLTVFSELFTGTQIHSANYSHWEDMGAASFVQKNTKSNKNGKDPSLADAEMSKNTKSRRERIFMRYSPLVERYLITHNYETINNVKKWQMLLTQRTEIQKDVDKKFKKFKQIADTSLKLKESLNYEFEKKVEELNQNNLRNKIEFEKIIKENKRELKRKMDNGEYKEYANMIASISESKDTQGLH